MSAEPVGGGDGVVFHLDEADPARQALVLGNMVNLLAELGGDTPLELVANGPGLEALLLAAPLADQVGRLVDRGVSVVACANTMRQRGVSVDRLLPGVRVVPSGVGQLVRRQREGWAYLRP